MEALSTKYRPKTFDDVVGQSNIIKILSNQVRTDSVKQGYLFTGGAGTGKTTSARILANSIDAEVLEIDGASNNGVDNIRDIREQVRSKPIQHKYKVVIIDEVHMLSTAAFNALLKVLEEPPAHAIFILATTDPQKIPATVLSRVQRFDFKRLPHVLVVNRLKYIVEQESVYSPISSGDSDGLPESFEVETEKSITVSDDAIDYIAKMSQGGMRSAISIMDTCLGYQSKLELSDVVEILGGTDYDAFFSLSSAIITQNFERTIIIIEDQHMNGKDLKQFIKAYTEFVVDIMKFDLTESMNFTTIPTMYKERIEKMLTHVKTPQLRQWFTKLSALNVAIRYETTPKVLIEGELMCLTL